MLTPSPSRARHPHTDSLVLVIPLALNLVGAGDADTGELLEKSGLWAGASMLLLRTCMPTYSYPYRYAYRYAYSES